MANERAAVSVHTSLCYTLVGLLNHYIVLLLHHGSTNFTTNIVVNCWDFHLHLVCIYICPPVSIPLPVCPSVMCVFILKCKCMWRPERDVERFVFSFCNYTLTQKLAVSARQAPPLVLDLQAYEVTPLFRWVLWFELRFYYKFHPLSHLPIPFSLVSVNCADMLLFDVIFCFFFTWQCFGIFHVKSLFSVMGTLLYSSSHFAVSSVNG